MATRGIVPRADDEGTIGTAAKKWSEGHFTTVYADNLNYTIPDASDTVKGIVELATSAETITGTDDVKAVTPAGLAALTATTTRSGVVELATDAEAIAGVDTARAVTPAALAAAIADADLDSLLSLSTSKTVGSGGDYATLTDALSYLTSLRPIYTAAGVKATITLKTGFVMQEQIFVDGIDLSWITISSEDATVTITGSSLSTLFGSEYGVSSYPAFGVTNGGKGPVINTLFTIDTSGGYAVKTFCCVLGAGSSINIKSGKGCSITTGTVLWADYMGVINAKGCTASTNSTYSAVWAGNSANICVSGATLTSPYYYTVQSQSFAEVNAYGATATSGGSYKAFRVLYGGRIYKNTGNGIADTTQTALNSVSANGIISGT